MPDQTGSPADLIASIDRAIAARRFADAVMMANRMLRQFPASPDAHFAKAKAEYAAGNFAAAGEIVEHLSKMIRPVPAPLFFLSGQIAAASGKHAEAATAYRACLAADRAYRPAFRHLASALIFDGQIDAAREFLESATQASPEDWELWSQLGGIHLEQRSWQSATTCLERAVALNPADDLVLVRLGFAYSETGRHNDAVKVLATDNGTPPSLTRQIRAALLLPHVYSGADDLERRRNDYAARLGALASDRGAPDRANEVFELSHTNFLLAYQGKDDRALQVQYADFLRRRIETARPDLLAPVPRRVGHGGRIRVAFASSTTRRGSLGGYFRSWFLGLDARHFEVSYIHLGAEAPDMEDFDPSERSLEIERGRTDKIADALRARNLDIIVYLDIAVSPVTSLLSCMRLAPVQCASWGHPVTTGSAAIDYYFSCADMEPEQSASHYSETLLLLPGIGISYDLPGPAENCTRTDLGLPERGRAYVCAQSLFKIHPANDEAFVAILERDSEAQLLFFSGESPFVQEALAARLDRRLRERGIPSHRIAFLPRMTPPRYRAVLAHADVLLDTQHFSGCLTTLDALAVGTPVVTLPGRFMRGRQSMAMLQALGLDALVAADAKAYVEIATAYAHDDQSRREIAEVCRAGRDKVFQRRDSIAALANHLVSIYESRRDGV